MCKPTIVQILSNNTWGGGEQYAFDLSKSLKEKGYNIVIVCKNIDKIKERVSSLTNTIFTAKLNGITDISSPIILARIINKHNKVIIHAHNFKDAFTAVLARKIAKNKECKIIVTRHLVKKANANFLYRWMYKQIDKLIFVSKHVETTFLSSINKELKDKLNYCVIHNSILIPTEFKADNIRKCYNLSPQTTVLMYHGRIEEEKGIHLIIEALKKIDNLDFCLFLLGTGNKEYISSIKDNINKCEAIKNKIFWLGFKESPWGIIKQAEIGLTPSIVKEACPLSSMEYMSQAVPVITTNNGGQKEYIENNKTGLLINPRNIEDLTKAIEHLILNKEERIMMGNAAREYFLKYMTYDKFIEKILKLYS